MDFQDFLKLFTVKLNRDKASRVLERLKLIFPSQQQANHFWIRIQLLF